LSRASSASSRTGVAQKPGKAGKSGRGSEDHQVAKAIVYLHFYTTYISES
jgi:hypothetical protein